MRIFYGIMSIPQNIVIDLNDVMMERKREDKR